MAHDTNDVQQITTETRMLLITVTKTIGRAMQDRLAKSGHAITPLQMGLMRMIVMGPHTISEISRMLFTDPSTLVPVVDTLEERGLVERRKDPADRRRVPLYLTDSGRQLVESMLVAPDDDVLNVAIAQMKPDHAMQLRDLLRELLNGLPEGKETICGMQEHLLRLRTEPFATPDKAKP